jgi:hypothetical protein
MSVELNKAFTQAEFSGGQLKLSNPANHLVGVTLSSGLTSIAAGEPKLSLTTVPASIPIILKGSDVSTVTSTQKTWETPTTSETVLLGTITVSGNGGIVIAKMKLSVPGSGNDWGEFYIKAGSDGEPGMMFPWIRAESGRVRTGMCIAKTGANSIYLGAYAGGINDTLTISDISITYINLA